MYGILNDNNNLLARFSTPMSITSNQPVFSSDSISLKRQTNIKQAQRWEIEASLEPLSDTANLLYTFLISKGYSGTIQVVMPQSSAVFKNLFTATGTFTNVTANAGATSLNVQGMSNDVPVGFFIRFGSHKKIYMITSSGLNTCTIYPPLRQSINNDTLFANNFVIGEFTLDFTSIRGFTFIDGVLMDNGSIKLVEKI
jgi:hypothetical protein